MAQRPVVDVSLLPSTTFGHHSLLWWGTMGFVLIEATVFGLAWVSYFYIRDRMTGWPPGVLPPALIWGTVNTLVMFASLVPNQLTKSAAEKKDLRKTRICLTAAIGVGLVFVGVRALEFGSLNVRWDTNAYGSIVWSIMAFHTFHLVTDVLDSIVLVVLLWVGPVQEKRFADTAENSDYWYFVVAAWVPTYLVVYLAPRWL